MRDATDAELLAALKKGCPLHAHEALRAIAQAEADERARVGWQPIATAPKDGTSILGGFFKQPWADSHRQGDIVKCWFQPEFNAFISSCRQMVLADGYKFEDGKATSLHSPVVENVSHWMPLPAPPSGDHIEQEGRDG